MTVEIPHDNKTFGESPSVMWVQASAPVVSIILLPGSQLMLESINRPEDSQLSLALACLSKVYVSAKGV